MTSTRIRPDRVLEEHLLTRHALVGGMDEVGRGSLAGPVSVGLAVVSAATPGTKSPSRSAAARSRDNARFDNCFIMHFSFLFLFWVSVRRRGLRP